MPPQQGMTSLKMPLEQSFGKTSSQTQMQVQQVEQKHTTEKSHTKIKIAVNEKREA